MKVRTAKKEMEAKSRWK